MMILARCQLCGAVLGDEDYEGTDEPDICGLCALEDKDDQ